jgi:hypothetical protein
VMFSRMAVTNSLLSKLVPKETEKRVPVEQWGCLWRIRSFCLSGW